MKYLVVAGALAAAGMGPAATGPPPPPTADLRQALQQYHPGTAPVPRTLSAGERAELRRQLSEHGQPVRRPPLKTKPGH
jgi:hypothetical protein